MYLKGRSANGSTSCTRQEERGKQAPLAPHILADDLQRVRIGEAMTVISFGVRLDVDRKAEQRPLKESDASDPIRVRLAVLVHCNLTTSLVTTFHKFKRQEADRADEDVNIKTGLRKGYCEISDGAAPRPLGPNTLARICKTSAVSFAGK